MATRCCCFIRPVPRNDLWGPAAGPGGVRLHIQRVFVMADTGQLMPASYLRFVRGVIDSSDLPLNISREPAAGQPCCRPQSGSGGG